jgi:hypothetical protein
MSDTPIFASVEQDLAVTYDDLAAGTAPAPSGSPAVTGG